MFRLRWAVLKARCVQHSITSMHSAQQCIVLYTQVDYSDIIAGRPKEVGLRVLAAVCGAVKDREGLSFVDVSENAMGPGGVDACRPALEGKRNLRSLFMCNDGLSEVAMETVRVRKIAQRVYGRISGSNLG